VQQFQHVQNGRKGAFQPVLVASRPALAQNLAKRAAVVARHHHVSRAVLLPELQDFDEGRVLELCQQPGLVHEAGEACTEALFVLLRTHAYADAVVASSQAGRDVLLDRDLTPQALVHGGVDDAEAALADHACQFEFA
jgi:hypothetical protein